MRDTYRIVDKDTRQDIKYYRGLTWDTDSIDKAYKSALKLFPNAIILKVSK